MSYSAFVLKIRSRRLRKGLTPAFPTTDPREDGWGELTPEDLFARAAAS
jgi:hypothetical protein